MSKEHVFPDWLRTRGFTGEGLREFITDFGPRTHWYQRGGPFSKTVKAVCPLCNNGWMSALENDAQQVLLSMFATADQLPLDAATQLLLARWAFKTTAVLTKVAPTPRPMPVGHCHELRDTGRPPRQTFIWIGMASVPRGGPVADARYQPAIVTTPLKEDEGIPAYRMTFRLLNVVFAILGWSADALVLQPAWTNDLLAALPQIWPPQFEEIGWPPAAKLDTFGGLEGLATAPVIGLLSEPQ